MNAATINTSTFIVSEGSENIGGSVEYSDSNNTATFTALNVLNALTDYVQLVG